MPTKDEDDGTANLSAFRGHAIGQMPLGGVTPFALLGFGYLGANSDSMGKDHDPALHFGAGVKVPVTPTLGIRFDLRDSMTQKDNGADGDQTHHPEVLLGLSLKLGPHRRRSRRRRRRATRDKDGFLDPDDKCPDVKGVAPDGCPAPDPDKDGFLDPDDKCPTEKGVAPDGCPDKDPDKDGILDPDGQVPRREGHRARRLPGQGSGQGRHPRSRRQVPDGARDQERLRGRRRLPRQGPGRGAEVHRRDPGHRVRHRTRPRSERSRFKVLDEAVKVLTHYPKLRDRDQRPHRHRRQAGAERRALEDARRRGEGVLHRRRASPRIASRREAPAPTSRSPTTRPRPASRRTAASSSSCCIEVIAR